MQRPFRRPDTVPPAKPSRTRIWFVSELYYPEETSTGYTLTRIAEGLALERSAWDVRALVSQPTYSGRGIRAGRRERRNGVSIRRYRSTIFDKNRLVGRALNMLTVTASLGIATVFRVQRNDIVFAVTNPPLLPFVTRLACALRRARFVLLVHDVYPDALVAVGVLRSGSLLERAIARLARLLLRHSDRVVTLSNDMADRVVARGADRRRTVAIPNWADLDEITPASTATNPLLAQLRLDTQIVLQFAGNIGHPHPIEQLVEAADRLRGDQHIHFLFIGSGAKRDLLASEAHRRRLDNITLLPPRPRSDSQLFLNACHVGLVALRTGMTGISAPSRFYNILAAGRPVLAVLDPDSELAQLVSRENIGWVVSPDSVDTLVATIREAANSTAESDAMGGRARALAESRYGFPSVLERYVDLLGTLDEPPGRAPSR